MEVIHKPRSKRFAIKECFYTLQGEGMRAGCASIFLRFAGCNLDCKKETHGFDCDTDFIGGHKLTMDEVVALVASVNNGNYCEWIVLTGGEPGLQLTQGLVNALKNRGYKLAIETNGMYVLPDGIDWICVSPKTPPEQIKQTVAHEVKFVIRAGDPIPETNVVAEHYLLSPAFEVTDKHALDGHCESETLQHVITLCLKNPKWRISEQRHKYWRLR